MVSVGCYLWWMEQGGIGLNPSKEKSGCRFRNHSGEGGFLEQLGRKGSLGSEHSYAYIKKKIKIKIYEVRTLSYMQTLEEALKRLNFWLWHLPLFSIT